MTNKAKQTSNTNGYKYLKDAFEAEQEVLRAQLKQAYSTITHSGEQGSTIENIFIEAIRKYLPKRYKIAKAFIIDCKGKTSDQIDIVIYDTQYTTTLLDQFGSIYIPCEAVYAVFEVKPEINKESLTYASNKIQSVRKLHRTSKKIPHAGGKYPPKKPVDILGGLLAYKTADWKDGFKSNAFKQLFGKFKDNQKIDCCFAIESGVVDNYDEKVSFFAKERSFSSFIFRLLEQLQQKGTVSAIDWREYLKTQV